ncbi:MAG: hypothetical protein MK105_06850 [Crocinitomicaceae bacterium]|nr:hypothetical protein [Crocinitomicaceae bacterium]
MKIIKNAIQVIFILAIIWGISLVTKSSLNKLESNNLNHIPKSAEIIIKIDGESLLKNGITELISNQDNDFIELIKDLNSDDETKPTYKQDGIAYKSDIILFKLEKSELLGAIFNLRKPEKFKSYFSGKKNISIAIANNVGTILFDKNKKYNTINIFKGPFLELDTKNRTTDILVWTKNEDQKFNLATISIKNETVQIEGEIANKFKLTPGINPLQTNGFHATLSTIPETFNDSIRKRFGDTIPELAGVSMNYYGTELIEEPEFLVAPSGDFLFEFKDSVNIQYFKHYLLKTLVIDSIKGNILYYGPKPYFTKQISDNIVYLGIHDYQTLKHANTAPLIHFSGDLTKLTLIEGGGFFKRLMEIVPLYGASKLFASKVEVFDIKLRYMDLNTSIIEGEIKMKNKTSASIEFLRFLLIGQFFQ